jgi:y4mF family transcriptional regulator
MKNDTSIGLFIRETRKSLGINQQKLADISGVGINFISQIEKGKETVRLDTTNKVLNTLGYRLVPEKIVSENITEDKYD